MPWYRNHDCSGWKSVIGSHLETISKLINKYTLFFQSTIFINTVKDQEHCDPWKLSRKALPFLLSPAHVCKCLSTFLLVDWSWSPWKSITLSKHKVFSSIMTSLLVYPRNLSFFFRSRCVVSEPQWSSCLCILAPHCGYTHDGITDSWIGSMNVNWSCIADPKSSLTHQTISLAPTFLNLKQGTDIIRSI